MPSTSLSTFIKQNKGAILQGWETFAAMHGPDLQAHIVALRDHASLLLETIASDLDAPQATSKAHAGVLGLAPLSAGLTSSQLVSHYRAARRSVLTLWTSSSQARVPAALAEMVQFNDAMDQALAESLEQLSQFAPDIQESEAKFHTLINAMPQMIWSALPDGFHDYFSQQLYDFTGIPAGSADGEAWSAIFHPEDQPLAWEHWRRSLATGEPYEIQYRLRHRSGGYRWVLGRALPVQGNAGEISRWMGTCTDIHEQKLAEQALQQASQRKDEFLAMLAHELRNPLAPISTAAELLKLAAGNAEVVRKSSEIIGRQVRHMASLVDDLLDVSRVTRGLVKLKTELIDLKLVVGSAVEQAQPLIEARHHHLQLDLCAAPALVKGDKARLTQVLVNLLNNAAKFTPQGGQIALVVRAQGKLVHLRVTDNGMGIEPALLPHVFDVFTQGKHNFDLAQGGLGLGLSLVKNIVSLHGGQATGRSDGPGTGSTFTLTLPLASSLGDQDGDKPVRASTAPILEPLSLMIVDDNVDAGQTLAALLGAMGHRVTVKQDAESALAGIGSQKVDVFILDIGLPAMDGYELAKRLRSDPRTAKAVLLALTGYDQAHDHLQSKEAGFDHYFIKPIDSKELTQVLARYLLVSDL